jgi:protein N-terminal methyltransferase
MWKEELRPGAVGSKQLWYSKADQYWSVIITQAQDSTVNAVLGGFEHIHQPDINDSRAFISSIMKTQGMQSNYALDCGAGIGRVTKHLLLPMFSRVDLVEQCEKYVDAAWEYVDESRLENLYRIGLQDFTPESGKYDCIWIQWVLSHLTDEDLISFLQRIKTGLAPNGVICIKENIKRKGFLVDKDDYSVVRSEKHFKLAFQAAGLRVVKHVLQKNFPEDLFKVKIFGCISNE